MIFKLPVSTGPLLLTLLVMVTKLIEIKLWTLKLLLIFLLNSLLELLPENKFLGWNTGSTCAIKVMILKLN